MAKTSERREQEFNQGSTWALVNLWESKTFKVRADLDPATFNAILALAKRYDAALGKFIRGINNKDRAKDVFDKLWQNLQTMDEEIDSLYKTIGTLNQESFATVKAKSGDSLDDLFVACEEMLKRAQGVSKEYKLYFDQFIKLNET